MRPYGYHHANAHIVQFAAHGARVRPKLFLEAEVTHARPVEEINDDDIDGNAAALELACHVQHLLLIPVAQLALPETETPFGHRRCMTGGVGILPLDVLWLVADSDPIIELTGGLGHPTGAVLGEFRGADCRVVPQEPIAGGGHNERD